MRIETFRVLRAAYESFIGTVSLIHTLQGPAHTFMDQTCLMPYQQGGQEFHQLVTIKFIRHSFIVLGKVSSQG